MSEPQFSPKDRAICAARALRSALMSPMDEAQLVRVVAELREVTASAAVAEYASQFGRDLVKDVRVATDGPLQDALVALLTPQVAEAAMQVHQAAWNLDFGTLVAVLCTRTDGELLALHAVYTREYGALPVGGCLLGEALSRLLAAVTGVEGRTDGNAEEDEALIASIHPGAGKETVTAALLEVVPTRSPAGLARLSRACREKLGLSMATFIRDTIADDPVGEALAALCTPPAEYLAARLHEAVKGANTDEATVVGIVTRERDRHLRAICAVFTDKYEKSLAAWLRGSLHGRMRDLMVGVVEGCL